MGVRGGAALMQRYLGDWTVARQIIDAANSTTIACAGRATLTASGDRVRYDEAVTFVLGGRLIRASRTYFYHTRHGTLSATFADGRPFLSATLKDDGSATVLHYCGPDVYTGTIAFREADWQTHWNVSGSKTLRITTLYTRPYTSTIAP